MKIQFESTEEVVAFLRASLLPWGERLSPLDAIDFAISELEQFQFLRNDQMIRFVGQLERLQFGLEAMTKEKSAFEERLKTERVNENQTTQ